MNKIIKYIKCIFLITIIIALLMGLLSCTNVKQDYFVTWKDADGTLIEYSTVDSTYDPTSRELPSDSKQWSYTGWNVIKSGNRIDCTALRIKKSKIQWLDADGSVLKEDYQVINDTANISYPLPEDSNEWHYTSWIKSITADGLIFNAKRIPKTKHVWKDADGSVIKEEYAVDKQDIPKLDLPNSNEKWEYVEWETAIENGEYVYTAVRTPNTSYFVGNVFQIIVKNADGTPLGAGSGFIINDEGWFITNNHVMDGASSAIAFFDIKDEESGNKYTQLNVLGGVYYCDEKDIFIGKLEGYEEINEHYNNITFTDEYTTGELSYSVGYPNSSVKIEINAGVILEEYSDIYDKINGIYYILSSSYIAPGSSGGILINENFEVIGITTIGLYADSDKEIYTAGGSVPTFVFSHYLNNLDETKIIKLPDIYY